MHSLSFVLNGGSYSNSSFVVSVPSGRRLEGAFYNPSTMLTNVNLLNTSPPYFFALTFKGNSNDSLSWADTSKKCYAHFGMSRQMFGDDDLYFTTMGFVKINSYGPVGDYISGTFSGTLLHTKYSSTGVKVDSTQTQANFLFVRENDVVSP